MNKLYNNFKQRQIEFRAWDKADKKMREPDDIGGLHISSIGKLHHLKFMEDTGLLDKNGKKIFEGDILKPKTKAVILEVVGWQDSRARFIRKGYARPTREYLTGITKISASQREIIGNIFENPELINSNSMDKLSADGGV